MARLSHLNEKGEARMVDVSAKETTHRTAVAEGFVAMAPATLDLIEKGEAKKGDVLATARIAGIMAAKRTHELIPLCHPLAISKATVDFEASREPCGLRVTAEVKVGTSQKLVFRETDEQIPPYDGHHIAIYINDFSGPHRRMLERGIVSEESNPYQYRFVDIVDPESGKVMFELEHEVRCVTHPMYRRPLINRNPAQRQPTYVAGRDAQVWS